MRCREGDAEIFTEVVIAPGATDEALGILAAKKNLRLLLAGALPMRWRLPTVRSVGAACWRGRDGGAVQAVDLKVVTRRAPIEAEVADLLFAWKVAKHVKPNATVCQQATAGIGAGNELGRSGDDRGAEGRCRRAAA